jgi:hypothetical protein
MPSKLTKTYSHILIKLAAEGGPDPARELRNILEQCRQDPNSVAWLATYHPAHKFSRAGNSICVIFHHPDQTARVEALVARVLSKEHLGSPPEGAKVRGFYESWNDRLTSWWPLGGKQSNKVNCEVVLTAFESLDAIPGSAWDSGKTASSTFVARCSFAGWTFEETLNPLEWLRSLPGTRP